MKGYPHLGTLYLLRIQTSNSNGSNSLVWSVIENNSNNNTSTLMVVEDCSEKGEKATVDATLLNEREPLGPILPPNGEIVIENVIEFIRPGEEEKLILKQ